MTNQYASERAAALIRLALDALRRGEDAEQLSFELGMVTKHEGATAVALTFDAIYRETEAEAKLHGHGSEAAQRLSLIPKLIQAGSKRVSRSRRGKGNVDQSSTRSRTAQRLLDLTALKILDTPPPGEPVLAIPAEEGGSHLLMRIGRREFSWVGSFAQGNKGLTAVQLMPDGHLFVAARSAGYILEIKSRALIEKIGDDVMSVLRDDGGLHMIVNHDERALECFGAAGRLWKTKPLGRKGFRGLSIGGGEICGQARQAPGADWTGFKVTVRTGLAPAVGATNDRSA